MKKAPAKKTHAEMDEMMYLNSVQKQMDETKEGKQRIVTAIFKELNEGNINLVDLVELAGNLCREAAYLVRKAEVSTKKNPKL